MRLTKSEKNTKGKASSGFSSRTSVGIDLTQDAVRIVQLSGRNLNQVQLDKYAIARLPKNVIKGTTIHDYDQLVAYLQHAYTQVGGSSRNIVAAVPQTSATIETVVYNQRDADVGLEDFVELEISQQMPLDEVNYDYQDLGKSQGSIGQKVLVVAARKEEIEPRLEAFDSAGLSLQFLDVDVLAQANAFNYWMDKQYPELVSDKVMAVHISENEMSSLVLQNGQILYRQESSLGGEQLNQLIQRTYQVSEEQAKVMRKSDDKPADYQVQIADRFNAQIAQEIQRVLQFYYTTQSGDQFSNVRNIFLSGSASLQANLAKTIFSQTNTAAECINPIVSVSYGAKVDISELQYDAAELTVAFGLALRGV